MTCPTVDEFKELLRLSAPEKIADDHIFGGEIYVADEHPRIVNVLHRHICPRLGLEEENVIIVGSAKTGFSLSPDSFPSRFTRTSDIDVLVVSELLFDSFWETMLEWHYPRRGEWLPEPDWEWVKARRQDLYWGWFHPDKIRYEALSFPAVLKPLRDLRTMWFHSFQSLSLYTEFAGRDVNGRLYRSWKHARLYQVDGLKRIKTRVIRGES